MKKPNNIPMVWFNDDKVLEKITGLTHEGIWDSGVSLDDWDYGFIIEGRYRNIIENDFDLQKILQGCCDNKWIEIEVEGKVFTIGLAYHS